MTSAMSDGESTGAEEQFAASVESDEIVVDMDMHVTEGQTEFLPHLDGRYAGVLKRVGPEDEIRPERLPSFYPNPGYFSPAILGKAEPSLVFSKEDILEAQRLLGIDYSVIDPTLNLSLSCVHHDDLASQLASAYNDWLVESIVDRDQGILANVVVAVQQPNIAAEEIDDRRNESGIVGVLLPSGGAHPPLGNEKYEPIYEAAERAGLPVFLHAASGTTMMGFPMQFQGFDRVLTNHMASHPLQQLTHLADMVVQGIPVRFPDLTVVFQEAGIGWTPYVMRRLDSEYAAMREDAPLLDKPPSEYIRDQFYFTTQPMEGANEPDYVEQMIRMTGVDNVMLSTDYPHFDFDHAEELGRVFNRFSSEERNRILGGTAAEILSIGQ